MSDDDITPLHVIDGDGQAEAEEIINEAAIELLEHALEQAKSGRLLDVMIVGLIDDGDVYSAHTQTLNRHQRIGMLEDLKIAWILTTVVEIVDDDDG